MRTKEQAEKIYPRIEQLEKEASESAVRELIGFFTSDNWNLRKRASGALITIGKSIIPVLKSEFEASTFPSEDLVYWIVQTLEGLKSDGLELLLEMLSDSRLSVQQRVFVVQAIGKIGDNRAVEKLISCLADESWRVQIEAASALRNFGETIIRDLKEAFNTDNVDIRSWVAKLLGQILGRGAIDFFKASLDSPRKERRYYSVAALGEIDDQEALQLVSRCITDESWLVRIQAMEILERKGRASTGILENILQSGSSDARFQAIKLLNRILGAEALPRFRKLLETEDLDARFFILAALAEAGGNRVVDLLIESFTDPSWLFRKHAANLLFRMGPAVAPQIKQAVLDSKNEDKRHWGITVLARFGAASIDCLHEIFPRATKKEKVTMIRILAAVEDASIIEFLLFGLADRSYSVKNEAFNALTKFSHESIETGGTHITIEELLKKVRASGLEEECEAVNELVRELKMKRLKGAPRPSAPDIEIPASLAAQPKTQVKVVPYSMSMNEILRDAVGMGASDIHIGADYPPTYRIDGKIVPTEYDVLTPENARALAYEILDEERRLMLEERKELDMSYEIPGLSRFRVNVFLEMKGVGISFRTIPNNVPTLDEIRAPEIFKTFCMAKKGLVLVTGPTGSGKSTTQAAMIDYINKMRTDHVITIEDPVEFMHKPNRCKITQREVNVTTNSFASALRSALREDPDVILVGEMRDLETIELAITAAETGHLVFGTVHTSSAASTVDRIIDAFPGPKQPQIRVSLSDSLLGIIAQTLVPRAEGKGRVAAFEVMTMTSAIANLIKEGKTSQINDYILSGKASGMQTLDDDLARLIEAKIITFDTAAEYSYNRQEFIKRYADRYRPELVKGHPLEGMQTVDENRNVRKGKPELKPRKLGS